MTGWVAGASLVSAGIGYMSSQNAAGAMAAAGKDPFGKRNRRLYQGQLNRLMSDPGAIFNDPAFQSALDLGLTGVERRMAAQGFLGSGNEATALMQFGQSFGLDWMQNQERFLAQLAGAGEFGSPQTMAAGAQMGYNGTMQALGQIGGAYGMLNPGGGGAQWGYTGSGSLNAGNYQINPNFSNPAIETPTFTPLGG